MTGSKSTNIAITRVPWMSGLELPPKGARTAPAGDSMKASDQKKVLAYGDIFVGPSQSPEKKKYRHKQVRDSSDYTMIKGLIAKNRKR